MDLRQATGDLVGITTSGTLESGESLLYDHDAIVREAGEAIHANYQSLPDLGGLLEHPFTMAELRSLHEAVIGKRLLTDTFRRRMEPLLEVHHEADGSPAMRSDGGRPAQLYVHRSKPSGLAIGAGGFHVPHGEPPRPRSGSR